MSDSLFFGEQCEGISQVAHQKMSDVTESLRLLTKNEPIAHFVAKMKRFAQKTVEPIPSPSFQKKLPNPGFVQVISAAFSGSKFCWDVI